MRAALTNFQDSLERIRDLSNEILANTVAAMADPQVRIRHETQQCGSVVLLTGYFEAFLKDIVRAFVSSLCVSNTSFTGLPEAIQNTHFETGGKILTEVSRAQRNSRVSTFGPVAREDVAERLYSPCFNTAAKSYVVLWEAFADTRANPSPNVVREIAQNLGMAQVWPTIATKSGSVHSDSYLTTTLQNLVLVRNACAHTGTVSPIPTAADLLGYADCLNWIATGLVGALEDELAKY